MPMKVPTKLIFNALKRFLKHFSNSQDILRFHGTIQKFSMHLGNSYPIGKPFQKTDPLMGLFLIHPELLSTFPIFPDSAKD